MSGSYYVCGVYRFLMSYQVQRLVAVSNLLWHKDVPTKVSVFVWRLLQNKLPTKDNLVKRDVISVKDYFCAAGFSEMELSIHLFLHCNLFDLLWYLVRGWSGFSSVDLCSILGLFNHYAILTLGSKARRSFLHLICVTCVWLI